MELHDKVIGHYLNINTISKLESLPFQLSKIEIYNIKGV
ncbi:hypothetical protein CBL21_26970 [Shigella flexneri]|nr:hypothetical protein CBL21_26970 [Shigella flexneri]